MTFRVGQKVVCVAEPEGYFGSCVLPVVGEVYTVRYTGPDDCRLDEIRNGILNIVDTITRETGRDEPTFERKNFRPAVERKTDISIFTEMLTDNRIKQPEQR